MALVTTPLLTKGEVGELTLNRETLFSIPKIALDAHFGDQSNIKKATMVFATLTGGQRKLLIFNMADAVPQASLYISPKSRDVFKLKYVALEDFDEGIFIVGADEIPGPQIDLTAEVGTFLTDGVYPIYNGEPVLTGHADPFVNRPSVFNSLNVVVGAAPVGAKMGLSAEVAAVTVSIDPIGSSIVAGPISTTVRFSEVVQGFTSADITTTNCSITSFSGSGRNYDITVTPTTFGQFFFKVLSGGAYNSLNVENAESATFSAVYRRPTEDVFMGSPLSVYSASFLPTTIQRFNSLDAVEAATPNGVKGAFTPVTSTAIVLQKTGGDTVSQDVVIDVFLSDEVVELAPSDFTVINGSCTSVTGEGKRYQAVIAPLSGIPFSVKIEEESIIGTTLGPNTLSNTLVFGFETPTPEYMNGSSTLVYSSDPTVTAAVKFNSLDHAIEASPIAIKGSATYVVTVLRVRLYTDVRAEVSNAFTVYAEFTHAVSDFVAGDVTVTNGALSDFQGSGRYYKFLVTPGSAGVVSVSIGAGVATYGSDLNAASPVLSVTYKLPDLEVFDLGSPEVTLAANAANNTAGNFNTLDYGYNGSPFGMRE